jgi:hypothetical protein
MLFRMRGSAFLAALAIPLAACSVLLDWSEYTGGSPDASVVDAVNQNDSEAAAVLDAAPADPPDREASSPDDVAAPAIDAGTVDAGTVDAGTGESEAATACVPAQCPNSSESITVEFQPCCLPDGGGCGVEMLFPAGSPCTPMPM